MEDYEYGRLNDIKRLKQIGKIGGAFLCKLDKMPDGHLDSMDNARLCDINFPAASTVTARYYKGIGSHKDNMVVEIWKLNL